MAQIEINLVYILKIQLQMSSHDSGTQSMHQSLCLVEVSPLESQEVHKSMNCILDTNLFITALIRKKEGSTLGKKQLKD